MSENKYVIISDDTLEAKFQCDISKEEGNKIDSIIEKAVKNSNDKINK